MDVELARVWAREEGVRSLTGRVVLADGQVVEASSADLHNYALAEEPGGPREVVLVVDRPSLGLRCEHYAVRYPGSLAEYWQVVRNTGDRPVTLRRVESGRVLLRRSVRDVMYFRGGWGLEFEPARERLGESFELVQTRGRSSNGLHPWVALLGPTRSFSAAVAWSGNWALRVHRREDAVELTGGLVDFDPACELPPGAELVAPSLVVVEGDGRDLNSISIQYGRVGRLHWYPHNDLSNLLPVEWNHWWPYEDRHINEEVFRRNVDVAAEMGFEVCTLDAGWFGPDDPSAHWYDYRGDWHMVNRTRFPHGIRALADYVHSRGMRFGIWCEIEAVGQRASLAQAHPEYLATRGGQPLGYACFGCPEVRRWALATLDALVREHGADWIKLDFNLDPGLGCDRTDHGHGAGDGLYAHYRGYYGVLDELRRLHPHVLLEGCSSGGLRIDLGLLRHLHTVFLSDPDWPEHDLQLFWGATTMLHPSVCLHWGWSEWITEHRRQTFDPRDPMLSPHKLDYAVGVGMLGGFGLSHRLPDLPRWVRERIAALIALYKTHVRRFVREGELRRLTRQPRRFGKGSRWAAFQYSLPEDEHLLMVFRLDRSEPTVRLRLRGLMTDGDYLVRRLWPPSDRESAIAGSELSRDGLLCYDLQPEDMRVLHLRRL